MKRITFHWPDPSNFTTPHPCMAVLAMSEMSLFSAVSPSVCQTHECVMTLCYKKGRCI